MNVTEFLTQSRDDIQNGYVITALTDRYIVDRWPLPECNWPDEKKVLEVRVFNESGENKLVRGDVSEAFRFRSITDETDGRDSFDEWQYLDIDETAGVIEGKVHSTGGGEYHLPLESTKNARILIRYYLGRYEETRQARVEDWRVVGFQHD